MARASISEHEAFEQELGDKNPQLQDYLATTGVIGDETIKDPNKRKKQQKKRRKSPKRKNRPVLPFQRADLRERIKSRAILRRKNQLLLKRQIKGQP